MTDSTIDVYDFDGTIYGGDASRDFLWFCLRTQPGAWREVPRQLWAAVLFAVRALSREAFKERAFGVLRRLRDPGATVEEFWRAHQSRTAPWYEAQRRPGDVIVSASPEFLLAPMATRLGARLIGTRMDPATGRMDGLNCRGQEKVRRLRESLPAAVVDRAYSDSRSDLPLLRLARRPYLVRHGAPVPLEEPTA